MVSRFAVSISVVSVASLFALWSACKGDPDFKPPPTTLAPDAREFHDARDPDAHVYEDAHEFHDAHVYLDAHEFHDAHEYMDAPIPRSCMNHPDPVMMGSGSNETETLIVTFDCGGYTTAGFATPTMQDTNGTKTVLPPFNFQCGFNVMMFNTQVTLTAYELTAAQFDIFCN